MNRRGRLMVLLVAVGMLMVFVVPALAGEFGDPNKVWLCHFDTNHTAVEPYADDRNGADPGFWTVGTPDPDMYLDGDFMVRWNARSFAGVPAGLNPGQVGLCEGNGGELKLVSVKALGDDVKGHRALNQGKLDTYPDGWKGGLCEPATITGFAPEGYRDEVEVISFPNGAPQIHDFSIGPNGEFSLTVPPWFPSGSDTWNFPHDFYAQAASFSPVSIFRSDLIEGLSCGETVEAIFSS